MIQVHERTYLERVDTKDIKNFQICKKRFYLKPCSQPQRSPGLLFSVLDKFIASSGLACEWVIPEKITPTTEGMLENLTGEGVNSSGNLDCIHFSCYESLSKGYNECIRPPSPLGPSEKIAPWQPSQNHLSVILVSQQRREPQLVSFELYCSIFCLVQEKREVHSNVSLFAKCISLLCENINYLNFHNKRRNHEGELRLI